jgi:hypothetical protein
LEKEFGTTDPKFENCFIMEILIVIKCNGAKVN